MLCVSAVPSIVLAFLCGSWQGSGSMMAVLSGDQAADCEHGLPMNACVLLHLTFCHLLVGTRLPE